MPLFPLLGIVHALAATVWTGGHLVLDLGVLLIPNRTDENLSGLAWPGPSAASPPWRSPLWWWVP